MSDKLLELIASGGSVMLPLMLCCAVLWFGLVYRLMILKRGAKSTVRTLLDKGTVNKTPFLDFIVEMKSCLKKNHIRQELDVVLLKANNHFSKFNTLVTVIVMISPLLGLLGTVGGMIETFGSLGDMSLFSQSGGIAGGISQALVSTQMGLAVAIPGLAIGRVLSKKQTNLMIDLEQVAEILLQKDKEVINA